MLVTALMLSAATGAWHANLEGQNPQAIDERADVVIQEIDAYCGRLSLRDADDQCVDERRKALSAGLDVWGQWEEGYLQARTLIAEKCWVGSRGANDPAYFGQCLSIFDTGSDPIEKAGALGSLGIKSSGVSAQSFARIFAGMYLYEVMAITGTAGTVAASSTPPGMGVTIEIRSWQRRDGGNMLITFQNDRVISKAQSGL